MPNSMSPRPGRPRERSWKAASPWSAKAALKAPTSATPNTPMKPGAKHISTAAARVTRVVRGMAVDGRSGQGRGRRPEIFTIRAEAQTVAETLEGKSFVLIRQSGETGVLYGSVSTRDLAEVVTAEGFSVGRDQFALNQPIKTLGLHVVPVVLHPEVEVSVTVNVARSPEEAERQARGESTTEREAFNLDDLGLEVGAALAEAGDDRE